LLGGLTENYEQPIRLDLILTDLLTGRLQNTCQTLYHLKEFARSWDADYAH